MTLNESSSSDEGLGHGDVGLPRRELAHRTNDGIDVSLFWSKASNRVSISVFHARSATALEFEVDSADALDAFNHPYAYAATGGARAGAHR